ncbi:PD-(D/E)XK nuclease family protein [Streptomyces hydrogenans]|uniref:PD-(D/E)XK nuclease family protein n=1 Tax=Streptomyces hydrogenans TaxID=1873719 RepID=UPI0035DA909A
MISDDLGQLAIKALHFKDEGRDRSQQQIPGPSSAGSCARQVYGSYRGWPTPNAGAVSKMAAIRGTAMHKALEEALTDEAVLDRIRNECPSLAYLADGLAVEGTWPGIPGLLGDAHVDCYHEPSRTVCDWKNPTKTPTKADWPGQQYEWQLSLYGYLLNAAGSPVENLVIVALPMDKGESGVMTWEQPYSEETAQTALAWLREQRERAEQAAPPEPEKAWWFCKRFCPYYSPGFLCGGVRSFGDAGKEK